MCDVLLVVLFTGIRRPIRRWGGEQIRTIFPTFEEHFRFRRSHTASFENIFDHALSDPNSTHHMKVKGWGIIHEDNAFSERQPTEYG